MSVHEQLEILEELAKCMRNVPRNYGHDVHLIDPGTVAGRLLLRAMENGFLAEPRYVELRELIEMSQRGDFRYQIVQKIDPVADIVPPLQWHAFRSAGTWFRREAGLSNSDYDVGWVSSACEVLASQIEQRMAMQCTGERTERPILYLERSLYRLVGAVRSLALAGLDVRIATDLQRTDALVAAEVDVQSRCAAITRAASVVREAIPGVDELVHGPLECQAGVWSRRLVEAVRDLESLLEVNCCDLQAPDVKERLMDLWRRLNRYRTQLEAIRTAGGSQMAEQQLPAHPNDCTLRVTDVAKIVGINSGEVSKMCDDKKLAFNGLSGHERRISKSSVIDLQLTLVADGMSKVVQRKRQKP